MKKVLGIVLTIFMVLQILVCCGGNRSSSSTFNGKGSNSDTVFSITEYSFGKATRIRTEKIISEPSDYNNIWVWADSYYSEVSLLNNNGEELIPPYTRGADRKYYFDSKGDKYYVFQTGDDLCEIYSSTGELVFSEEDVRVDETGLDGILEVYYRGAFEDSDSEYYSEIYVLFDNTKRWFSLDEKKYLDIYFDCAPTVYDCGTYIITNGRSREIFPDEQYTELLEHDGHADACYHESTGTSYSTDIYQYWRKFEKKNGQFVEVDNYSPYREFGISPEEIIIDKIINDEYAIVKKAAQIETANGTNNYYQYAVVNKNGEFTIDFTQNIFGSIQHIKDDLIEVHHGHSNYKGGRSGQNEPWDLYTLDGRRITNTNFEYFDNTVETPEINDNIICVDIASNDHYAFYDTRNGNLLFDYHRDDIFFVGNNHVAVIAGVDSVVIHDTTNIDDIKTKEYTQVASRFINGYLAVNKDGLWGFIDHNGKIVLEPCIDADLYIDGTEDKINVTGEVVDCENVSAFLFKDNEGEIFAVNPLTGEKHVYTKINNCAEMNPDGMFIYYTDDNKIGFSNLKESIYEIEDFSSFESIEISGDKRLYFLKKDDVYIVYPLEIK